MFKYSCLRSPHHYPHPTHSHYPPSVLPPLAFSMVTLYMFLDEPSPISPNCPSTPYPLFTVTLFLISMSRYILFACLFC